jgi:methionyl-tRNA formyltransferase
MLPEEVWRIPPRGTINLHASFLPDYRGAAPINRAIMNGETTTGVTTFFIDEKIDTGNIILREEVQIFPFENAGDLHDRLMKLGARLVIRTLAGISENKIKALAQTKLIKKEGITKLAPKIHPNDCIIDWNLEAVRIHNLVRGLSPHPGARSWFRCDSVNLSFKIFESQPKIEKHAFNPGTISSDGKQYIMISCKDGYLNVISLQLEGKSRMGTEEFLRGFRVSDFNVGTVQPV